MSDSDEPTIAQNSVLTKYKTGAEIVNRVLDKLIASCVDGGSVQGICKEGEKLLLDELKKVYRKDKDLSKGVAFPICVSINNCINHFSPPNSESDVSFKTGDLVKLDLGVHIDGFISVVAHSLLVGASKDQKITGRAAEVMLAAHYAAEAAVKLLKPGTENSAITSAVTKVAEAYKCNPVEGMLSFQLQQNRIDGDKMIQQLPVGSVRKDVERATIEEHEVYAIDVVISTGKGQGKEMDTRVSIYKKTDEVYNLKLKCSREFFRKVSKELGHMPFNLRVFDDEKKARMGVMECVTHKLVTPYPVLWEKPGELVAQFKYTVLILPDGPQRITGCPLDVSICETDIKLEDNLAVLSLVSGEEKKPETAATPAAAQT
jgi:curved DNA binding protein